MKRPRPTPRAYSVTEPLIAARFWSKVGVARPRLDKDPCWNWREGLDRNGYGQFTAVSCAPSLRAHRVAWELVNGPVPDGLLVLHDCDNRACCNPSHLHLGTNADNMREMAERGRAWRGGSRRKEDSFLTKWERVIKKESA